MAENKSIDISISNEASRTKKHTKYRSILFCILFLFSVTLVMIFTKRIQMNKMLCLPYDVKGVDVSHYQGEIDWDKLQAQGIKFAFIKATEGSSTVDDFFTLNWENAQKTNLYVGAYHFFSFDSDGKLQAEHYIDTVGELTGCMLPVVDVEFYGDKRANPPSQEQVVDQLKVFLDTLENTYHIKPMIYCTYSAYDLYIKNEFDAYPLWIRNVYFSPNLDKKGRWDFWQYSDRAVLDGYSGDESYIDLNAFIGSEEELKKYLVTDVKTNK